MYSLYEGSVKVGFESETVLELLQKLNWEKGEKEYGSESFRSFVDIFATPEEWASHVDYIFFDSELYEDSEECEREGIKRLREAGVPRSIDAGQCVIGIDDEYGDSKYLLFDGSPSVEDINSAFEQCLPDDGYRIVEE